MRTAAATTVAGLLLATVLTSCGLVENEGRTDEAEATVRQFFTELAGASDDRGWSRLSASMREGLGSHEIYLERLEPAAEEDLSVVDVGLIYEDDGYYQLEVSMEGPIQEPYADVLFGPAGNLSPIACRLGDRSLVIVVLIRPFSADSGISGDECKG